LLFALNRAAVEELMRVVVVNDPPPVFTVIVAGPVAVLAGIRRWICPGETKNDSAWRGTPALSVIVTETPPDKDGRGSVPLSVCEVNAEP